MTLGETEYPEGATVTIPFYPDSFRGLPPTLTSRRRTNHRVVSVPEHASALVKLVFSEIARQRHTLEGMEASGVTRPTIKSWKRKRPGLESLQAVLNFLGWDLVAVSRLECLPADFAADLVSLARRADVDIPTVWREALNVAIEQRVLAMSAAERHAIVEAHHARILNRPANDNRKRPAKVAS